MGNHTSLKEFILSARKGYASTVIDDTHGGSRRLTYVKQNDTLHITGSHLYIGHLLPNFRAVIKHIIHDDPNLEDEALKDSNSITTSDLMSCIDICYNKSLKQKLIYAVITRLSLVPKEHLIAEDEAFLTREDTLESLQQLLTENDEVFEHTTGTVYSKIKNTDSLPKPLKLLVLKHG